METKQHKEKRTWEKVCDHFLFENLIGIQILNSYSFLVVALLKMFKRYSRRRRVISPLLKTVELLFNRGYLYGLLACEEDTFGADLLACVRAEERNCGDTDILLSVVNVSLGLLTNINKSKNVSATKFKSEASFTYD